MKTISAEEFKKRYGEQSLSQFVTTKEVKKPGYLSRVGQDIKGNFNEALQSQMASASGQINPLAAGANIAKNISGAAIAPVAELPGVRQLGQGFGAVGEYISETEPMQRVIDKLSKYPELAGALADTLETGLNVAGVEGTIAGLKGGFNWTKNRITQGKSSGDVGVVEPRLVEPKGTPNPTAFEVFANDTSAGIMNRVARLKPTDATAFERMAGKTQGQYLKETGNFGAPDKIITNEATKFTNSKNMVDTELGKLPGVYKAGPISDALKGLQERAKLTSTENVKSPYLDKVNSWIKKYNEGGLTMKEINEVKRLYEKEVKLGYDKRLNPDAVQSATNVDSAVREYQIAQAKKLGFENISELNKQTQISKFLIDKLGDQMIGQNGLNSINLTDWIVLGGGSPESIAGFLTKKFFSSKGIQAKIAEELSSSMPKEAPTANVNPTIENSIRSQSPQGLDLPELPEGKGVVSNEVPIKSFAPFSAEPMAIKSTRTTINPKTGDIYIKDLNTGKTRIIPRSKLR